MNDAERVSREVVIANRTYPLKIFKHDEERILKIVRSVNENIEHLRSVYDAKDNQDYLAMCLLQLATQNTASPEQSSPANIEVELAKIESLLSQAI